MLHPVGTKLRFIGEPHPETGEPRHLGDHGPVVGENSVRAPLNIGSTGVVAAHVPADVKGAGSDEADCTVLAFPDPVIDFELDGVTPRIRARDRNISFEDHQLEAWFEPVDEASHEPETKTSKRSTAAVAEENE